MFKPLKTFGGVPSSSMISWFFNKRDETENTASQSFYVRIASVTVIVYRQTTCCNRHDTSRNEVQQKCIQNTDTNERKHKNSTHLGPCSWPWHPSDSRRRHRPRGLSRFHRCWGCPHRKSAGRPWLAWPSIHRVGRSCSRYRSVSGNFLPPISRPISKQATQSATEGMYGV
jgi:hypothetical protein